jgi:hypothetical protein
MLTCEECGCLVDPELTEKHQDFHEDLVTKSGLNRAALANPNRTTWESHVQDC